MMERLRLDFLAAVRSLSSTPVPAAATIITVAVAVGVNLAMFGLIDRAVLSPPPLVADPSQLFTLGFHLKENAASAPMTTTSYVAFTNARDNLDAISGAAAFARSFSSVIVNGEQRRVNAMLVSGEYFDLLGISPAIGRGIHADDDRAGATPVVLSRAFWRSAFNGDTNVVGRKLSIGGLEYEVSGVMPADFTGHSPRDVDLWITFAGANRNSFGWDTMDGLRLASILVRVAPGQTAPAVEAQASALFTSRISLIRAGANDVASNERRVAWWLGGVSIVVLFIGLANAATLLVVRAARTRHDVAIRAALGASRPRLMRQGVIEALVLALAATGVALVLASWMDESVRRVLFPNIVARPGLTALRVWSAVAAGAIAAIVGSIANIWQLPARFDATALAGAGPGGGRRTKTMTALLLVQTTLSVVLLAGAGMFAGSLYKLWSQDFGMQMSGVLLVDFEQGPGGPSGMGQVFASALERVRALPDVEIAAPITTIPFTGFNVPPIEVPGKPRPSVGRQLPFLIASTPELFTVLRLQVVKGRGLTEADDRGTPVVLVNESMARGVWQGESAIGKCIRIGFPADFQPGMGPPVMDDSVPCREVVGIVKDIRQRSLLPEDNEDRLMQYYVPISQVPYPPFMPEVPARVNGLLVRPRSNADAVATSIRRAIVGERSDLPFVNIREYAQVLDRQMRPWSMGTTLLALFSALAVGVAAIGLYATFAYAVSERRREMAIRLAVGAGPGTVLRLVLREAVVLSATGAAFGCAAAAGSGRWIRSLLYGTEPSDPLVLGAAALAMVLVAALATWWPARTASKADPSVLLRTI